MLVLVPEEIHLWFAFYNEIQDKELLRQCRLLLTEEEQQREKHFYYARDQHRFLITRAMVRTVLSLYATIAPNQWQFSRGLFGKPEIANEIAEAREISFNITHTQGLIVLAVTYKNALGVDVENSSNKGNLSKICTRYFSEQEISAISNLPKKLQADKFLQYWTLKESYLKARGAGLSIPLNQFSFNFIKDDHIEIWIDPRLNDTSSRWRFWQFRPSPHHVGALCVENPAFNQNIVMKEFIPLQTE
jgi:4'-phosphopantetheinyl transferase